MGEGTVGMMEGKGTGSRWKQGRLHRQGLSMTQIAAGFNR
jgi:hypothetical protein